VEIERHRSDVDTWERDRDQLEREKESRDKRQSKDITPLDHRGSSGIINIVEHQTNSQDRRSSARREIRNSSKDTSHNGNNGNVSSGNSSITNISTSPQKTASGHRLANGSGMNSIIFPLLTDIQRKYQYAGKNTSAADLVDLQSAFELAERSCPGVSDLFVKEIIHKLIPGYSETRINTLMEKVMRKNLQKNNINH